jgi:Tfp pilus assembly protein PilF
MRQVSPFLIATLLFAINVFAQDDEVRQGSGTPMQIGENALAGTRMNVSGKIAIENAKDLKRPPVVSVTIIVNGSPVERAITNSEGFYVIRNVPRTNSTILIEIDGVEMVRQPIMAPAMGSPRIDYTVSWPPANSLERKPAVVFAEQPYNRSEKLEATFQRALTALKASDNIAASKLFGEVVAGDPKDFVSWTELGTIYFRANAYDNAEACYFKAIELKKDYTVALLNLGKLYLAKKQYDNSILVLSNAVKAAPSLPDAHHHLGEAYLNSKKGTSAVYHFNEAIRLAPTEKADLHLRIATLYDAAKMKDKAANEYKTYLTKNPNYVDKATLEAYIRENSK